MEPYEGTPTMELTADQLQVRMLHRIEVSLERIATTLEAINRREHKKDQEGRV
jgi:hypothetical protein